MAAAVDDGRMSGAMLYLILVMRTPAFQASLVEAHQAFLASLRERGVLVTSGPFTDRSGGAYLLRATDRQEAEAIAHADPLHTSGSSAVTIHEWRTHPAL